MSSISYSVLIGTGHPHCTSWRTLSSVFQTWSSRRQFKRQSWRGPHEPHHRRCSVGTGWDLQFQKKPSIPMVRSKIMQGETGGQESDLEVIVETVDWNCVRQRQLRWRRENLRDTEDITDKIYTWLEVEAEGQENQQWFSDVKLEQMSGCQYFLIKPKEEWIRTGDEGCAHSTSFFFVVWKYFKSDPRSHYHSTFIYFILHL